MFFNTTDLLADLPGEPAFRVFRFKDVNPLQGTLKFRRIHDPNEAMRILHQRIIDRLRAIDYPMPKATGARPGSSPLRNVLRHRKSRFFYLLDIHSAYLSVDMRRLAQILLSLNFVHHVSVEDLAAFLVRYCGTVDGTGLAIGGPASPDLFNLDAACLIDGTLADAGKRYGFMYSRYLDDLTFSSFRRIGKRKRTVIRSIILEAGFTISHRKARVYDLKKGPITINGVGLECGGRVFLPRHYLRKISGMLRAALAGKPISDARISGLMGVFWSATERGKRPTAGEQHIIDLYEEYRRRRASPAIA